MACFIEAMGVPLARRGAREGARMFDVPPGRPTMCGHPEIVYLCACGSKYSCSRCGFGAMTDPHTCPPAVVGPVAEAWMT